MVPVEYNYEIYNKELLAIVKAFKNQRPELEGSSVPVKILTDYRGLEYFQTKRTLTRRQARQAEKLSEFNFVITYRDGKSNIKADALTRQAGSIPTDSTDERLLYQNRVLLNPEQFLDAPAPTNPIKAKPDYIEINDVTLDPDLSEETIYNQIRYCVAQDEEAQRVVEAIRRKDKKVRTNRGKLRLNDTRIEDRLIWFQNRIWVPEPYIIKVIQEAYS